MTKIRITIFIMLTLTLLCSCGGDQPKSNDIHEKESPKALQDDNLEIRKYSRSGDLVEELYAELVDKFSELKKLEKDLNELSSKPNELTRPFHNYNNKSMNYYNSVDFTVNSINDSLLKKKVLTLIATSKSKHSARTAEMNAIIKRISQNIESLNEHYSVLKIVLTLPLIEKYQAENLPSKKELNDLIKEQQKLIQRIDRIIP